MTSTQQLKQQTHLVPGQKAKDKFSKNEVDRSEVGKDCKKSIFHRKRSSSNESIANQFHNHTSQRKDSDNIIYTCVSDIKPKYQHLRRTKSQSGTSHPNSETFQNYKTPEMVEEKKLHKEHTHHSNFQVELTSKQRMCTISEKIVKMSEPQDNTTGKMVGDNLHMQNLTSRGQYKKQNRKEKTQSQSRVEIGGDKNTIKSKSKAIQVKHREIPFKPMTVVEPEENDYKQYVHLRNGIHNCHYICRNNDLDKSNSVENRKNLEKIKLLKITDQECIRSKTVKMLSNSIIETNCNETLGNTYCLKSNHHSEKCKINQGEHEECEQLKEEIQNQNTKTQEIMETDINQGECEGCEQLKEKTQNQNSQIQKIRESDPSKLTCMETQVKGEKKMVELKGVCNGLFLKTLNDDDEDDPDDTFCLPRATSIESEVMDVCDKLQEDKITCQINEMCVSLERPRKPEINICSEKVEGGLKSEENGKSLHVILEREKKLYSLIHWRIMTEKV
ncbi:uncharacterized protein LOC111087027 isoform X2 [Limulus polyphemus]|uniref:Uncharacterized protein LOC111087027 isoform X1 n=1 Tax=Limulus polyphemus TaxID=6850 RepID=A0ABM1SW66_LIMPO|nr:uncharacterized protein LOC111087027 isoform X1 [Limulus polyphemus]XP_022247873.1 uncharacterized protein LOC111087027 isoform X2 [Limulus polyphemus]